MSDKNKNDAHPGDDCMAEYWARALGLSTQRLMALVEQVVAERSDIADPKRQCRLATQPSE